MPWQDLFLKIILKIFDKEYKKPRNIIKNVVNVQGIANLLAEKHDDLYNSLSYDTDGMSMLK